MAKRPRSHNAADGCVSRRNKIQNLVHFCNSHMFVTFDMRELMSEVPSPCNPVSLSTDLVGW